MGGEKRRATTNDGQPRTTGDRPALADLHSTDRMTVGGRERQAGCLTSRLFESGDGL